MKIAILNDTHCGVRGDMIFMRVFRSSSKRDAARTSFTQLLLYHLAKPKRQMFFLLALGKCATRKAMRAGRFLDKSAFLFGHGARTIPSSSLD